MGNITDVDVNELIQSKSIHELRPWIGNDGRAYIKVYDKKGTGDRKDTENYSDEQTCNAVFRKAEWAELDRCLKDFKKKDYHSGINDLINYELVRNLGGMVDTVSEWSDIRDALATQLHMDGVPPCDELDRGPLPITYSCCNLNIRALANNRSLGVAIDIIMVEMAIKKIYKSLDKILFTDNTYKYAGRDIYSYINHPNRNTEANFEGGMNWLAPDKTEHGIIQDVLGMKEAMIGNHFYGPFVMYIPPAYATVLDRYYKKIRNTIRKYIIDRKEISNIRIADLLPADNVLLVNMSKDTVRLLEVVPLTNIQWLTKYIVFTIQVPQIHSNANDPIGIVHMS